jgi:hypothetical protein
MNHTAELILAADCDFLDCIPDPFYGVMVTVLRIIGAFVLLGGIFKAVGMISQGGVIKAVRLLIFTLVMVTLLFFPELLGNLISAVQSLVDLVISSIQGLGKSPSAPAPTAPAVPPLQTP